MDSQLPKAISPRMRTLLSTLPPLKIEKLPGKLLKFTIFNELPLELRQKIWGLVAHTSRLVIVEAEAFNPLAIHERTHQIKNQSRVPEILQVSKESRAEGLMYYKALKECTPYDVGHSLQDVDDETWIGERRYHNIIYANFATDTFIFSGPLPPYFFAIIHNHRHSRTVIAGTNDYNFAIEDLVKIERMAFEGEPDIRVLVRHQDLFHCLAFNNAVRRMVISNDIRSILGQENVLGHRYLHIMEKRRLRILRNHGGIFLNKMFDSGLMRMTYYLDSMVELVPSQAA